MPKIVRSTNKLSPSKVRAFRDVARRINGEEASAIKARGREIFKQHEQLRAILQDLVAQRQRQGITLTELASRTGIRKSNLSRLESSTSTTPTLDTLERYARALGKTLHVELVDAGS